MKSRLDSSAIHATSGGVVPGINALGAESSTSRVRAFTSASWYARRPAVTHSSSIPKVVSKRLHSLSICASEVAPKSTSLDSLSHSTGMHLRFL
jgi:hypothetical protein